MQTYTWHKVKVNHEHGWMDQVDSEPAICKPENFSHLGGRQYVRSILPVGTQFKKGMSNRTNKGFVK